GRRRRSGTGWPSGCRPISARAWTGGRQGRPYPDPARAEGDRAVPPAATLAGIRVTLRGGRGGLHATPHRGLPKFTDPETGRKRHMSPDEAWAAHVASGFRPVMVDANEADDLFRP